MAEEALNHVLRRWFIFLISTSFPFTRITPLRRRRYLWYYNNTYDRYTLINIYLKIMHRHTKTARIQPSLYLTNTSLAKYARSRLCFTPLFFRPSNLFTFWQWRLQAKILRNQAPLAPCSFTPVVVPLCFWAPVYGRALFQMLFHVYRLVDMTDCSTRPTPNTKSLNFLFS